MISKKYFPLASYPFPTNRWGIPTTLSLLGGGENSSDFSNALSKSSTWGSNSFSVQNQLPVNGNRTVPRSNVQMDSIASMSSQEVEKNRLSNKGQKQPSVGDCHNFSRKPGENSWAHVAGKGLDSIPNNERVQFLYDVLLSPEGWGKDNVNQESTWELPPSPPIAETSAHSRLTVNNGCDLWQNVKDRTHDTDSGWDDGSCSKNKMDAVNETWMPVPSSWRNSVNDIPDINWTSQQKLNGGLDQHEINSSKACLSTNMTTATQSIPSISSPSVSILPSTYSLSQFTHKESQLLHGQTNVMQNTKDSAIGITSPLVSNVQLPLERVAIKPKQQWDNVVSNDAATYITSQQVGPHWVAMPTPSIPDYHIMSSQSHGPLIAPHLQHPQAVYKSEQIIWPQVPSQDYQSEFQSGWPNMTSHVSPSKQKLQNLQLDSLDDANRENAQSISSQVSQIEFAIRAGYLSYNIYNEPLAPNSIVFLNHLLSAINFLHKLLQQQTILQSQAQINKNTQQQYILVVGHINKVKQQIQYLQNQISSQQAMYVRQLSTPTHHTLPIPNPPVMNPSITIKNNVSDSLLLSLSQMNVSRNDVNGWKVANGSNKLQQPNVFMMAPERPWSSQAKEQAWHVPKSSNCISPTVRLPNEVRSWSQQNIQPHEYEAKIFQSGKPWLAKNVAEYSPSSSFKVKTNSDMNLMKPPSIPRSDDTVEADHISSLGLSGCSTWTYKMDGRKNVTDLRPKVSQNSVRKDLPWSESRLNSDAWLTSTNQTSIAKKNSCWEPLWPVGETDVTASSSKWSNDNSSTWLVIKNLTPEVDGSTLKTLCLQHGPLENFHLVSNFGFALANYGNKEEANKAQSNLNNCLLSNTTILAEFISKGEVNEILTGFVPPVTTSWTETTKPVPSTKTNAPIGKSDGWSGSSSIWPNGTRVLWSAATPCDGIEASAEYSNESFLSKSILNMEPI